MEKEKVNAKKTKIINGIHYYKDRPESCEDCSFWKNNKKGCRIGKENCYYLAEEPDRNSRCYTCPYARDNACLMVPCYLDYLKEGRTNGENK